MSPTPAPTSLKSYRVVSVSLGSSTRDHSVDTTLLDFPFCIERRGTDGCLKKAAALISDLDGSVDAIGLGGIDLYLVAGARRYVLRDAARLAARAKSTPVVDGSGLKDTLERQAIDWLQREKIVDFQSQKVLLACAVDRFGMAEELEKRGATCTFGDFLFVLGWPVPMEKLSQVQKLGAIVLPIASRLPFKMLYPTGEKQTQIFPHSKQAKWMQRAEIIAGDFLLMRRYLPETLENKIIITNTVTSADIELLRARKLKTLVTTTPEFRGRSFGTNVMEGVFAALGARTPDEYSALLQKLNWTPRVVRF